MSVIDFLLDENNCLDDLDDKMVFERGMDCDLLGGGGSVVYDPQSGILFREYYHEGYVGQLRAVGMVPPFLYEDVERAISRMNHVFGLHPGEITDDMDPAYDAHALSFKNNPEMRQRLLDKYKQEVRDMVNYKYFD